MNDADHSAVAAHDEAAGNDGGQQPISLRQAWKAKDMTDNALPSLDGIQPAETDSAPEDGGVVTVRPTESFVSRQGLPTFEGVSATTAGAKGLTVNLVVFPPSGETTAHYHDGFESAIYHLEGEVETLFGENLDQRVVNGPGDFVFIPPFVPHTSRNLSDTRPAKTIVCRNDASDQESVVPYEAKT